MADHTRPVSIGYYREIFFATPTEKAAIRKLLMKFAAREGYTMDSIRCQEFDQKQSEFERLIELAKFQRASAVVIPTAGDLTAYQRRRLEVEAGAHILVAPPADPTGPGAPVS